MTTHLRDADVKAAVAARRAKIAATSATLPYNRGRHLDTILRQRNIATVFQPIVDLETRETVAYEALTRGPRGTPLERPDLLFGTARELGLVGELDWICRATAMERAMASGFGGVLTLFVNIEPDVAATRAPEDLFFVLKGAQRDLRVVLEVTERALLDRPAELLNWLSYARERWWGVALDDVGCTPESAALLPFVNPDVIKLNAHLLHEEHTEDDRRVLEAIHIHADRTGATVLAEGIENRHQMHRAVDELGATLGQGWYFGRPSDLPGRLPSPRRVVPLLDSRHPTSVTSAYEVVATVDPPTTAPEAAVRRVFAQVEQAAMLSTEAPVVLGCFPPEEGPWGIPEQRLSRVRSRACFCGALGVGLPKTFAHGWQTGPLAPTDDLANEWVLVSIAPHQADVVVAFDAEKVDADGHRLLEVCRSRDREVVARVAEMLMRRLGVPSVDLQGRLHL